MEIQRKKNQIKVYHPNIIHGYISSISLLIFVSSVVCVCVCVCVCTYRGFPGGSVGKNLPANAGDLDLISGLGRSP